MRIVRFEAQDVLRLSAVEIEPTGDVVTLGGGNEQGKTSILNTIEMTLAGKRSTPAKPIRDGAKRARSVIDLGDLIVERVITQASDRLTVRTKDGEIKARPQDVLDKLFSAISFDPLRFASDKPEKQAETLRQLVGLDFTDHDKDRAALFQQRTDINRDHKKAAARLEHTVHHLHVPEKELDVSALAQELARRQGTAGQAAAAKATVRQRIEAAVRVERDLGEAKEVVARLERELEEARAKVVRMGDELEAARQSARGAKAAADAIVVEDPAAVQAQLAGAEATNKKVRENAARAELVKEVAELAESSQQLTTQLAEMDETKQKGLESAKYPVEGLRLTDGGVLLDGLPFEQASKARQLRVSLAIGMALNPELRVLLVRDGSVLDPDGLRIVAEMAAQHDYQVWLEDTRTTDPAAVIIEDGQVKGAKPRDESGGMIK